MPKRTDLSSILIIGAGPIVIGQACEFDYSGTQAARALQKEGYRTILVNSNPASIMTDPGLASKTYVEPLTLEYLESIIEREKPDAILSTMGGQTALNLAMQLHQEGILGKHNVEILGAGIEAIRRGEDREEFRRICRENDIEVPKARVARSLQEGLDTSAELGFPVILRPAFTLGGTGGGIARDEPALRAMLELALLASPVGEVLIEESVLGWKEFELEVMRDTADRCLCICSIENVDPMGVHTGDSITVAPALTLSDKDYQRMRDAAFAILRSVGVATGGSNVQFALDPETGRLLGIEMNPRVSRSSALASKVTGFPIAKIAALLAVGYLLDEITNDITGRTKAAFEPALDYVVTKIPRFAFEKFKEADQTLTTSMKSVGEVMAIGRTFPESLQKALRGLEIGRAGFGGDGKGMESDVRDVASHPLEDPAHQALLKEILPKIRIPNCDRLFNIKYALMLGVSVDEIASLSSINRFFIGEMARIVELEREIEESSPELSDELLSQAMRLGFTKRQIEYLTGRPLEIPPSLAKVYKSVDTCAGEFEARTPYYYGTFGVESEVRAGEKPRILLLGSGPNRIGQGIEFDCSLCHATWALQEEGYEAVMVNSNPETVSTDYDTADLLFFDPVVGDDVRAIYDAVGAEGTIVTIGGQTPLSLAHELQESGAVILGTSVESIDRAEDRRAFSSLADKLGLHQPDHRTATFIEEALEHAKAIGYPILVRPSYVLGGRAMMIAYDDTDFRKFAEEAIVVSEGRVILIDEYLENAVEADVDVVSDGERAVIAGIMEHVEPAGVHSGDSAAAFPAYTLPHDMLEKMKEISRRMAIELNIRGLLNIQYAVKDNELYVIEANPRASRTVSFLEKATGIDWSGIAARIMVGRTIDELGVTDGLPRGLHFVKEVVLPFNRFENVDALLTPEMKSTGEVMGIGRTFEEAYYKSQVAAGNVLPTTGGVLISVGSRYKESIVLGAGQLAEMGYELYATEGTAEVLRENNITAHTVAKIDKDSTEIIDLISMGAIRLVINIRNHYGPSDYGRRLNRAAIQRRIPVYSTVRSFDALVSSLRFARENPERNLYPLQEIEKG